VLVGGGEEPRPGKGFQSLLELLARPRVGEDVGEEVGDGCCCWVGEDVPWNSRRRVAVAGAAAVGKQNNAHEGERQQEGRSVVW
jgi:hypothetical protein